MSACSRYELLQWSVLAIMLIAGAFAAYASYHVRRATRAMRTADSARMSREIRKALLDGTPVVGDADPKPRTGDRIKAAAIEAARHDYRTVGRARANPHAKHTKQFAAWAIEYAHEWNVLHTAGEPKGGPKASWQTPGAHGFSPPPPPPLRPVDPQSKSRTAP
jgi:hypothetical protein